MVRKKTTTKKAFWTYEMQNIVAGGTLVTLGFLMWLSTEQPGPDGKVPVIGKYLSIMGEYLYGSAYQWIFAPIILLLGVMILVKKASWSISRFVGLLLFFIALTSLVGKYYGFTVGLFDIHATIGSWIGSPSDSIFFIVLFLSSLYLTLRISYRHILSKVRNSVPSMSRVREAILPTDDYEDDIPVKKTKTDEALIRKSAELERKIAELQKSKKEEPTVREPK